MGRKQEDSSVFLGTKAFRKERTAEWWCLPFCLDGAGYYPSCHLWQDLIALPPQRGEEETCQVKVKACCFGRGLLLFTQQSGRAAAPHQTTCLLVSKQHRDVCMKWAVNWAAGHRWGHIPPELLTQAFINVWCFCFFHLVFYFTIPVGGNTIQMVLILTHALIDLICISFLKRYVICFLTTCLTLSWMFVCLWMTTYSPLWSLSVILSLGSIKQASCVGVTVHVLWSQWIIQEINCKLTHSVGRGVKMLSQMMLMQTDCQDVHI